MSSNREDRLRAYQNCLKDCPMLYNTSIEISKAGPADASARGPSSCVSTIAAGPESADAHDCSESKVAHPAGAAESFIAAAGRVSDHRTAVINDVCDFVLSPVLNAYVLWVLSEALKAGKKRLYFLARDACFMYRAAAAYCEAFDLPIECRYLCCSRYSVRIPMYHLDFDEALEYICRGGIDVTMEKILNRAGLSADEKQEVLKELEETGLNYPADRYIPYAELAGIKEMLKKSGAFYRYTVSRSKEEMPNLKGYLKQEGLLDDVPFALVDSGWVGSMQKLLGEAIEYFRREENNAPESETGTVNSSDIAEGKTQSGAHPYAGKSETQGGAAYEDTPGSSKAPIEGYYWGLYELPPGVDVSAYHCYYFSPGGNIREKVYFSNCLFEAVFSAPHGMTLNYRMEDGRYVPQFADVTAKHVSFMRTLEKRFDLYTSHLIISETENYLSRGQEGKVADAAAGSVAKKKDSPDCCTGSCALQREDSELCPDVDELRGNNKGLPREEEGLWKLENLAAAADKKTVSALIRLFMCEPTPEEAEIFGSLPFSDDVVDYGNQELASRLTEEELTANHAGRKILSMLGLRKTGLRESAWYEGSAVRGGKNVKRHLNRYAAYKRLLYMRKRN